MPGLFDSCSGGSGNNGNNGNNGNSGSNDDPKTPRDQGTDNSKPPRSGKEEHRDAKRKGPK